MLNITSDVSTICLIVSTILFTIIAILRGLDDGTEDYPFSICLELEHTWYRRITRSFMIVACGLLIFSLYETGALGLFGSIIVGLILSYVFMVLSCYAVWFIGAVFLIAFSAIMNLFAWITE